MLEVEAAHYLDIKKLLDKFFSTILSIVSFQNNLQQKQYIYPSKPIL